MMPRQSFVIAMLFAALTFSGCAATVTALKYKDLEIQTKMSETIFLEPVSKENLREIRGWMSRVRCRRAWKYSVTMLDTN